MKQPLYRSLNLNVLKYCLEFNSTSHIFHFQLILRHLKHDSTSPFYHNKKTIFLLLISEFLPNYLWISHRNDIRWNHLKTDQVVNRFPRVIFTTKTGLTRLLFESGSAAASVRDSFYPRCYEVINFIMHRVIGNI